MFGGKYIKKNERIEYVKSVLSELYNGLSSDEYGTRYAELNSFILDDYKRLEKGTHPTQIVPGLLTQLNREVLTNLHLQQSNPDILTKAIGNLKSVDTQSGLEKTFNNFENIFPR